MDTTASPQASQEIAGLDAVEDCARIAFLLSSQLFPLTIEKALEYALFKTFAVPSISKILAGTREFSDRGQKRYDDTVLVLAEITEGGHCGMRSQAAYARLNDMHGRFKIRDEDFLYTLGTFIFEPIRALKLYGPRPMTPHEEEAWFQSYLRLGRGMKLKGLPAEKDAFYAWYLDFEKTQFRPSDSNRTVADATMDVLFDMLSVPQGLRGIARKVAISLMEPHVAEAFEYDRPSPLMAGAVSAGMSARRLVLALLPERRTLRLQTRRKLPTYPHGYEIDALGTFVCPHAAE
ncbi:MAG: oxygenase MpaB family protein [Pseudomonadota bacterium]